MFKLKDYHIFLDQIYYIIYFIIFTYYFISYLNYATRRDQYQYVMLTVFVYSVSFFLLSFFPPQALVITVKALIFIHFVSIQPILVEKRILLTLFI